jgi:predicted MFS family arabinose efflux permease
VISQKLGWKWIFGFLSILSGVVWIAFLAIFPETSRKIVGNGSKSPRGINRTLLPKSFTIESSSGGPADPVRIDHIPNPLPSLFVILYKDTAIIEAVNALFYVNYICLQASLSPLLVQKHGLSGTNIGLCYLSYGIACAIATYGTGMLAA